MAKGIRVNLLAKELGVESKLILQKLKEEGLSDAAPNHMSTLSLGLAESVREWFGGHVADAGGTAVETAPPIETKTKAAKSRKKKEDSTSESSDDEPVAEAPEVAPAAPVVPPPAVSVTLPPVAPPVIHAAPVVVAPIAPQPPKPALEAPAPVIAPPPPPAVAAPSRRLLQRQSPLRQHRPSQ